MDRTGIARGSLRPVIYFEHSDGRLIIAPESDGLAFSAARKAYETKYSREGWMWREAGTLAEVDALQKRLQEQERRRVEKMVVVDDAERERVNKRVRDVLRSRMVSSDTSAFEKRFIEAYLQLREDKRSRYRDALLSHNWYIWAREQDSGTKDDLMLVE